MLLVALAGLVAVDADHNLNFCADETLASPSVLLTNVASIVPRQEHSSGLISSNPTYSFLEVLPTGLPGSKPQTIHRIDYTGAISGVLYTLSGEVGGAVVESNTLYVTDVRDDTHTGLVARIPGDGTAPEVLSNLSFFAGFPELAGVTGANLVFSAAFAPRQWAVQTLTKGAPGAITALRRYDGGTEVGIASGDILVTSFKISDVGQVDTFQLSTQRGFDR